MDPKKLAFRKSMSAKTKPKGFKQLYASQLSTQYESKRITNLNPNKHPSTTTPSKSPLRPQPQPQPQPQTHRQHHLPIHHHHSNRFTKDLLLARPKASSNSPLHTDIPYPQFHETSHDLSQILKECRSRSRQKGPEGFTKSAVLRRPNSNQRRERWDGPKLPLKPEEVIKRFSHYLTGEEIQEVKEYHRVYYIGHKVNKGFSYETESRDYNCQAGDHIAYRYELIEPLGKGAYGQVWKVFDHKRKQSLALKIIKNKKQYTNQAHIQIKILTYIRQNDRDSHSGIVKIKDFLMFRRHICLLFQLLHHNLYELLLLNQYQGLDPDLIRRFAIQLLNSLTFLHSHSIIHCDLKPENILLKTAEKSGIRLIDFGSSCFKNETIYSYIQSRYYRAPEITLEMEYDMKIDMWSLGCILAELYVGAPLFPGESELEQMRYMVSTLGVPPKGMRERGRRSEQFFEPDGGFCEVVKQVKVCEGFGRVLGEIIEPEHHMFREFLQSILKWQPSERPTPKQALLHPWIVSGLPEQIRNMHDKLFNEKHPNQRRFNPSKSESSSKKKDLSNSQSSRVKFKSKSKEKNDLSPYRSQFNNRVKLETKVRVDEDGEHKIQVHIRKEKRQFFK